ncbi:MAG: hypothetical protein ACP5IO_03810 [Elusimicrobiales bacterium]
MLIHRRTSPFEVIYLKKVVDSHSSNPPNPEYSIENYTSSERFPFEDDALSEGIKRNSVFQQASITPLHNYAVAMDNDWTFSIDYAVKNIYKNGVFVKKEYQIKRYINQEVFDFEKDAQKTMSEKISNFNSAGLYVISSAIYEISNGYSFWIDYIEKN